MEEAAAACEDIDKQQAIERAISQVNLLEAKMTEKVNSATQRVKDAIVATGGMVTKEVTDALNRFQRVLGIFEDVEDLFTLDTPITLLRPLPPEVIRAVRAIEAIGHPRVIRGSTAGQPRVNCG